MSKILEFQKEVEAIKKDSKNPFFKSNYFDINSLLAEIKPLLNKLDLVLIQPLRVVDGKNVLKTILIDGDKEILAGEIILPDLQDPQKLGSAITYYRRYSIQSMLLLQAEDDDGNNAKPEVKQTVKPTTAIAPAPVKRFEVDKKKIIAELLKKKFTGNLKEANDYKEACIALTGFELLEANYDEIINFLKQ